MRAVRPWPGAVGGEDVGGELVDEPHCPHEQRPEHVFGDAGGGVLAGAGGGLAPAVDVAGVEPQAAGGQGGSPQPEFAGPCACSLAGSGGWQRADQVPLVVLKVGAGQGAQPGGPAVCPAQEAGEFGEGGADSENGGPLLARGTVPDSMA